MYKVIVADDETHLREALINGIDWGALGFSVVGAASNGAEALELVESHDPDLLLTDIKMPFVSGTELARRAREIRPQLCIAFISGYDDFNFAREGIRHNVISYILRPVSAAEMTRELTRIKEKMDGVKMNAPPKKEAPQITNAAKIVGQALQMIETEYADERMNLSAVAERLHVSVSYFCALFKKEQNETFGTALTKKRMEKARELLLSSQKSIGEIAETCGYSDIFYFSYGFKKYYGVAPSKMRADNA